MSNETQAAIADIEFIRTVLENDSRQIPDRTEVAIHLLVSGASIVLLIAAFFLFPNVSDDLMQTQANPELRNQVLIQGGIILALVGAGIYALAYLRAKELESTLARTLNRHFDFLKLETFLPDLALKAFVLTTLVMAKQPQYLAATLVAFTADYALQGRFFRLNRLARLAAGAVFYALAITMMINGVNNVGVAIASFAAVSCVSSIAVLVKRAQRG